MRQIRQAILISFLLVFFSGCAPITGAKVTYEAFDALGKKVEQLEMTAAVASEKLDTINSELDSNKDGVVDITESKSPKVYKIVWDAIKQQDYISLLILFALWAGIPESKIRDYLKKGMNPVTLFKTTKEKLYGKKNK